MCVCVFAEINACLHSYCFLGFFFLSFVCCTTRCMLLLTQIARFVSVFTQAKPKREGWMTELPEEHLPSAVPLGARTFRRTEFKPRGDTSVWTDTPADRERKAAKAAEDARRYGMVIGAPAPNEAKRLRVEQEREATREREPSAAGRRRVSGRRAEKSLMKKHQEKLARKRARKEKKRKRREKGDRKHDRKSAPEWVPWDREAAFSARQLSGAQLKGVVDRAGSLTSRFQRGS
jgi:Protein of unknown function (DUF3752)